MRECTAPAPECTARARLMRIARARTPAGVVTAYLDGDRLMPVADGSRESVVSLANAVRGEPGLRPTPTGEPIPLEGARLLAPVPAPPSLRDFYAFEQHVRTARAGRGKEMLTDWYELPVFYFSNPAAIVGPGDPVAAPPRCAQLDYELEVALVLSRGCRDVALDEVDDLVAGFCVMNDWSARDVQRREMALQMGPVKGKDFATSLGPWLVTADEFAPGGLREVPSAAMTARVNGAEWSRADLADLWWSFAEMVVYASEAADLRPGDVLGSGTCGTGCILELSLTHGSDVYPWLRPGDLVELEVEGLGVLANPVVTGTSRPFTPDPDRRRPRLS